MIDVVVRMVGRMRKAAGDSDRELWNPDVQLMPREWLRELRNEWLQEVIRQIFKRSAPQSWAARKTCGRSGACNTSRITTKAELDGGSGYAW